MLKRRLARRWIRRLGWLLGGPLAIFRFLRREILVEEIEAAPTVAPLSADEPSEAARHPGRGLGALTHHLYAVTVRSPKLSAGQLLAIIAADPNVVTPTEVLRVERSAGALCKGDELLLRMAGPWNGPMRVSEREDDRLQLATMPGHPQHGKVELRVRPKNGEADIVIEIQTCERAAGFGFYLLERIGLIPRMRSHTWAEILQNAARLAGGLPPDRITVQCWRGEDEASGTTRA